MISWRAEGGADPGFPVLPGRVSIVFTLGHRVALLVMACG